MEITLFAILFIIALSLAVHYWRVTLALAAWAALILIAPAVVVLGQIISVAVAG